VVDVDISNQRRRLSDSKPDFRVGQSTPTSHPIIPVYITSSVSHVVTHLRQTGGRYPYTDVRIERSFRKYADLVVVVHPADRADAAGGEGWFARLVAYLVAVASRSAELPRIQLVGIERCSHRGLGLDDGADVVDDVRALVRTSFEDEISKYLTEDAEPLHPMENSSAPNVSKDDPKKVRSMWAGMGYGSDLEALAAQVRLVTMDEFKLSAHSQETEPIESPTRNKINRKLRRWVRGGGASGYVPDKYRDDGSRDSYVSDEYQDDGTRDYYVPYELREDRFRW
jgi:hypothetical protein